MKVAASVAAAVALTLCAPAEAQVLAMGTSPQGTWTYSAGAAIAKVAADTGMQMRVQPYAGTTALLPLMNRGELDFGLANHLEAVQAVAGDDAYEGRRNLDIRVVSVLTPLNVAIFVRADSPIRSIAELKGKRVPTEFLAQRVIHTMIAAELANGGLDMADIQGVPVPNVNRGADEFTAGRTDAFYFALGSAKVMEANAARPIRALSVDPSPAGVAALRKFVPVAYAMKVEPSPNLAGVVEPTYVMAYDYLALTNSKVPDATVYQLAKAMHANRTALKDGFPPLAGFAQDKMAKDLGEITYHPGAIKFFTEAGLWPPKS